LNAKAAQDDELSMEYSAGEAEEIPDDEECEDSSDFDKRKFYNLYQPFYERASNTQLIDNIMHAEILYICTRTPGSRFEKHERGYHRKFQVQGNVQCQVLY
jgi:hypothetical protein